ncbi:MAG: cysteine hydrolase [Novosphingobium sp.]|nr:cysteine hydrolase [Novosphingobium sp.]
MAELDIDIADCAIVTFEMQRGIAGDLFTMPVIREAILESGIIGHLARLFGPMRAAGVPIVHQCVARRPDMVGTYDNMPFITQHAKDTKGSDKANRLQIGNEGTQVVPEIYDESDIIVRRLHGVSGFHDTGLDSMLRSLGKNTIILTGSSVNRGITGTTIEAINRGYKVVLPREGVSGYPLDYKDLMLEHSLRQIAKVVAVDDLLALL